VPKVPLKICTGSQPVVTWGAIGRTAQRAEVPGLAVEGITVFSRCQFNLISILIPAQSECRRERVVETSPHSLIARYGGPDRKSARGGPLYWFSHRSHVDVLDSPGKSVHANSAFKGSATP
jgi:hypothetical protein